MDDRQQQIQVGAGLQESRLNTDLIAFLEKWGTWILTVVLVVVAGYVGLAKWREYNAARHDDAFDQYAAARGSMAADGVLMGSPDNLLKIAAEHSSRGAVAHLARLDAAEIYLGAARRGLELGADLGAPKPEDALTPERTAELLKKAGEIFEQVRAETAMDKAASLLNLRAQWGQASIAVSNGDIDGARKRFAEIESFAAKAGFAEQVEQAKARAATLDSFASAAVLMSDKDLPAIAAAAPAGTTSMPIRIENPDGLQMERMPEGFVPPGAELVQPPTPARTAPEQPGEPFVIPPQEGQPGTPPAPKPEQPKP